MELSPTAYRLLSDAIVVAHFGFVLFAFLGGLLVLRWRRVAWVHLPCAAWGVIVEFTGWICPLTTWEKSFRELGRTPGYEGGFVEHYVAAVMYPDGLTRGMQLAIGLLVLAVNVAVYWHVFRRRKRTVASPTPRPARSPSRAPASPSHHGR